MSPLRVISLGAGVQSSTLALMAAAGEFDTMPDHAIFADTQWEPAHVYRQVAWLAERLPFPVHVVTVGNLAADMLARRNTTGGRFVSVPWFVKNPDGSLGMGRRQCTNEYKIGPIRRKERELAGKPHPARIAKGAIEEWVGISADEADRMKPALEGYVTKRWPLIERNMTADHCRAWLAERGFHIPEKSACIGCPFHSQRHWQDIRRDHPDEFEQACVVDEALRSGDRGTMRGKEYMHPARIPLREAVNLKERHFPLRLWGNECAGICGV